MRDPISRLTLRAAALCLLLTVSACGPSTTPTSDTARSALESALGAWRDGKKPTELADLKPPVQVVDTEWSGGRKLASYEILREEPSEADKRFVVKLGYATPPAEAEVTYILLGTGPVSVFRDEDFARTMNMDNSPTPKKKRAR